jgi:PAS domain S-box-containing protein
VHVTERVPATGARVSRRARTELARAQDLRFRGPAAVVAGAFVAWGAIALKATLIEATGGEMGYILPMAAAVVAAWFAGLIGGLTATIVALVLNLVLFIDSGSGPLTIEPVEEVRLVLYVLAALGTVVLVSSRRASRDRLAQALDDVSVLATEIEARDTRLELMLAASGTGFWEWDVETGALSWSDAIFRQHGLSPDGDPPPFEAYLATIHPDDRPTFQSAIDATLAGSGDDGFDLDFRVVWPDGSIHWTRGSGRAFRDRTGRPVRMLGTGQDITERHLLEVQRDELVAGERRTAQFREAFIDVISHELRTPITTILGLAQIIAKPGRTDDPVDRAGMLDDIRAESERLHRLVEDLLVLSRVERGRLEIDMEPLEPRRMLERVVAHESIELPTIDIRLQAPPRLPIVVGELSYVEQILRNLLGNAAKYTPPGSKVIVDARLEHGGLAIRVQDDGPGIRPESRDHLFELFYRDPISARTVSGSGIGLFVCANLAEAMGTRLWVRDSPQGGAEFGFTLRAAEADELDIVPALASDGSRDALVASGTRAAVDRPGDPTARERDPAR